MVMAMYTLMRLPRSFAHRSVSLRFGWCVASILLVPIWGGCARMETVPDAKPSDLQVTVDQLKIAVRDAQRTAADLRAELDGQRQQLAEVELERARLQGMLRETERRLTEARQIIELQREELASARTERERMAHALRSLPAKPRQASTGALPQAHSTHPESIPRTITIQAGDTLWDLSRRHNVSMETLRVLNGLRDSRLLTGRKLRLPDPPSSESTTVPAVAQ
ncbi:MAG: LysM peptidoglycan-binding domain-containing protein [Nitrospira sp. NTP2]|nr:LysM peptidoglycan-binding domain-containing protein [Nitrospira sp. NTP2]